MDEESPSEDVAQLARFLSDVGRLTSHLQKSELGDRSLGETLRVWQRWQADELRRRYDDVINAQLPRWMYLRNPYRVLVFSRARRRYLREATTLDPKTLEELDMLLCRAQFGFLLAAHTRRYLRQKISVGAISSWTALSVLRSEGCKISKTGFIVPRQIGWWGLSIGTSAGILMLGALMTVATVFGQELSLPCVRPCVLLGTSQMAVLATHFAALLLSVSLGRWRGAKIFSSLNFMDDVNQRMGF